MLVVVIVIGAKNLITYFILALQTRIGLNRVFFSLPSSLTCIRGLDHPPIVFECPSSALMVIVDYSLRRFLQYLSVFQVVKNDRKPQKKRGSRETSYCVYPDSEKAKLVFM